MENKLYETRKAEYLFSKYIYPTAFIFVPFLMFAVVTMIMTRNGDISHDYFWSLIPLFIFLVFFNLLFKNFVLIKKVSITDDEISWNAEQVSWKNVIKIKQFLIFRIDIYFNEKISVRKISIPPRWSYKELMLWPSDSSLVRTLKSKLNRESNN